MKRTPKEIISLDVISSYNLAVALEETANDAVIERVNNILMIY